MNLPTIVKAFAIIEFLTGVGLLVVPSTVAEVLAGQPLSSGVPLLVARVAAVALIALATICWLESRAERAASPRGLLIGVLTYNAVVPLVLVHGAVMNGIGGIGLWPTVALHAAFAVLIVLGLRAGPADRAGS